MIVDNLEFRIQSSGHTAARGTDRLKKSLNGLKGASGNANKGLGGLLHTMQRLTKMMILRQIIRAVMKALKEGLENAYKFNSMVGGEMSAALDQLKSASVKTTGAIGSAFGELLATITPILTTILNFISKVANAIAQIFAVLGGRSKYTKAVDSSEKWADATAKGAKAAKEWKNQLMGFDEINRLEDQSDNGSGSGEALYAGAFELADASSEWAKQLREITMDWWNSLNLDPIINAWDRLKASLKSLASVIDDYLYFAYKEVLLPLGTWAIEEALPATIHMFASAFEFLAETLEVLKPYAWWVYEDWLKPLANWVGDHFVYAMWRVQDAFVQAREYVKSLAGLSPAGVVNKLWNDLIAALQRVDWTGLGKKIIEMLKKALTFVKDSITSDTFANIVQKAAQAAGVAIGAGLKIVGGALLELLQSLANIALDWSSNMKEAGTNLIVGLFQGMWNAIKGVATWVYDNIFVPFWDAICGVFGIHSPSTVMAEIGGYIMEGLWNGMKANFSGITEIINTLSSFFSGLGQTAHAWLQNILDGLVKVVQWCQNALSGLNQVANKNAARIEADGSQYLPGFASGGFPDEGQLFMAREGGMPEMVGTIGGRTAVATNADIVAAVSDGVYSAVVSAMGSSGGGSSTPIKIYLDGREIASTTTKYQRQFARAGTM